MRLKYLKQYTDSRKQQAAQIQALSLELAKEKEQLEIRKQDKEKILAEAQRERQKLEAMRREQQGIVNTLTKKEKSIRSQITATKKTATTTRIHDP